MKYADISGLSDRELMKKQRDLRQQMFEANMKNALGQLTNPMTIREMRRDIARLNTAMTAKSQGLAGGETKASPAKARSAKKAAKTATSTSTKSKAKAKA